jgi:hypothetical protein
VGTPNHARIRAALQRELTSRGFSVEQHAFSGRPSRAFFGAPRLVHGINLIARPSERPAIWLVAHYDSKGQPISMAVRLAGFAALSLGIIVLAAWLPAAVILLVIGGGILLFNRVNDNSPGALDNAAALIAVFMALDQLPRAHTVGVIFPDAEEYGLVGARALARERADLFEGASVVNLDGLDDAGRPTAFLHRPGPLGRAVADALHARRWRWLPVIVDGIALARVARECVTIMKGNSRTMRIVHRPADIADRVRLDGAAAVAAGLARVLRRA